MTRRFPKMIAVGSVAAALAVGGAGVAQASPDHGRSNDRPSASHERHSGDGGGITAATAVETGTTGATAAATTTATTTAAAADRRHADGINGPAPAGPFQFAGDESPGRGHGAEPTAPPGCGR